METIIIKFDQNSEHTHRALGTQVIRVCSLCEWEHADVNQKPVRVRQNIKHNWMRPASEDGRSCTQNA